MSAPFKIHGNTNQNYCDMNVFLQQRETVIYVKLWRTSASFYRFYAVYLKKKKQGRSLMSQRKSKRITAIKSNVIHSL